MSVLVTASKASQINSPANRRYSAVHRFPKGHRDQFRTETDRTEKEGKRGREGSAATKDSAGETKNSRGGDRCRKAGPFATTGSLGWQLRPRYRAGQ